MEVGGVDKGRPKADVSEAPHGRLEAKALAARGEGLRLARIGLQRAAKHGEEEVTMQC